MLEEVPVFEFASVAVMVIDWAIAPLVLMVKTPFDVVLESSPKTPLPSLSNCTPAVLLKVTTVCNLSSEREDVTLDRNKLISTSLREPSKIRATSDRHR